MPDKTTASPSRASISLGLVSLQPQLLYPDAETKTILMRHNATKEQVTMGFVSLCLSIIGSLLLLVGCSADHSPLEALRCEGPQDCSTGQTCQAGYCIDGPGDEATNNAPDDNVNNDVPTNNDTPNNGPSACAAPGRSTERLFHCSTLKAAMRCSSPGDGV